MLIAIRGMRDVVPNDHHLLIREYIEALKPHDPDQLGSASLLLFGPAGEISAELAPLIASYRLPPHADGNVALSFGVGASGSGVPFHVHGHGWAECIHGAKVFMVLLRSVLHCSDAKCQTCRHSACSACSDGCCSRRTTGRLLTRTRALVHGCEMCSLS